MIIDCPQLSVIRLSLEQLFSEFQSQIILRLRLKSGQIQFSSFPLLQVKFFRIFSLSSDSSTGSSSISGVSISVVFSSFCSLSILLFLISPRLISHTPPRRNFRYPPKRIQRQPETANPRFLRWPTVQPATNGIEYVGRRQVRTAEPYQPVDPEHPYGIGRTGNHFGDAPPLETDENGRAKYFYESDFAKYQLDDARTDIRYVRTSPEAIQKDLDAAGDIDFYYGVTQSGRTVMFSKTEQGWQSPQPGIRPEPSQDRPEPAAAQRETEEPAAQPAAAPHSSPEGDK